MSHSIRLFRIALALVAALTFAGRPARVAAQQPSAPPIDASAIPGSWAFVVDSPHGKMTLAMELRLESGKVLGTISSDQMGRATITGAFAEQTLKFTAEASSGTFTFTGKFKDRDTISGFLSGHAGDLVGIATRVKPSEAIPRVDDAFVRRSVAVAPRVSLIYKPENGTDGPGSLVAPFEGNVTVVEQAAALVVVDAGGTPLAGRHVVAEIRKLSPKPVAWLIYTHYHGDHNLGAGALREAWPKMRILSTEATRVNMTGAPMEYAKTYDKGYQETLNFAAQQYDNPATPAAVKEGWAGFIRNGKSIVTAYAGLRAWPPDATFTTSFAMPDDVAPVEVRFLGRANTDGDAVVWLPNQRVVVSGDIVVHPLPYASATYPKDWIATLEALKAIDYKYLIPGHGAVLTDRAYLDTLIGALADVRTQIGALAGQGLTFDEARTRWDFSKLKATFCGDDPWKRFLLNAFYLGALTQNAWKEAKGIPIVQGKDGGL